jgi:hypothetical protein
MSIVLEFRPKLVPPCDTDPPCGSPVAAELAVVQTSVDGLMGALVDFTHQLEAMLDCLALVTVDLPDADEHRLRIADSKAAVSRASALLQRLVGAALGPVASACDLVMVPAGGAAGLVRRGGDPVEPV